MKDILKHYSKYILLDTLVAATLFAGAHGILCKGQILRSTPNTAPLICGACNTQPEGLSTMA